MAVTAPESAAAEVEAYAARYDAQAQYLGSNTWAVNVEAPGDAVGEQARALVDEVRAAGAPFPVQVTGPAAEFIDQQATIAGRLPLALTALAGLTFVLLWLMTGSIVLPLKAIVMNALTVGAALAPLVLLYDGVEPTNFLVAAALIFALSTDYGVFLLGRIKEARDSGESEREAVAIGIARTGRVVTAAAILLAVAIGAFSTSAIPFIQQIGIAVAFGVLIDAFIVRSLLVPSLMALLGKWNWWSPKPLRRLHARVGISEGAAGRPRLTGSMAVNPTLQRWLPVLVLPPILLLDGLLTRQHGKDVDALDVLVTYIAVLPLVWRARLGFFALGPLLAAGVALVLWPLQPGQHGGRHPRLGACTSSRASDGRRETIIAAVALPALRADRASCPFAHDAAEIVSLDVRATPRSASSRWPSAT